MQEQNIRKSQQEHRIRRSFLHEIRREKAIREFVRHHNHKHQLLVRIRHKLGLELHMVLEQELHIRSRLLVHRNRHMIHWTEDETVGLELAVDYRNHKLTCFRKFRIRCCQCDPSNRSGVHHHIRKSRLPLHIRHKLGQELHKVLEQEPHKVLVRNNRNHQQAHHNRIRRDFQDEIAIRH